VIIERIRNGGDVPARLEEQEFLIEFSLAGRWADRAVQLDGELGLGERVRLSALEDIEESLAEIRCSHKERDGTADLVMPEVADVFEHLENLIREALDFVAESRRDIIEALVKIRGGGLDMFVQIGGIAAALGIERVEFLVESLADIAFELSKRLLGGEALHDEFETSYAGLDLANIGVEGRLAPKEGPCVVCNSQEKAKAAEENEEADNYRKEWTGVFDACIREDHIAPPFVAAG
jgi:hypothetical protein